MGGREDNIADKLGVVLIFSSAWQAQGNSLDNKGEESDSRYRISWLFIRPIDLFTLQSSENPVNTCKPELISSAQLSLYMVLLLLQIVSEGKHSHRLQQEVTRCEWESRW